LWNEFFQNYLRQILSAAKIPLVYLTRDERDDPDNALDPADFGSPMEYLIEATVLQGRHSNPQPPNLPQNLLLPQNQDNEILNYTKITQS
jgi:hypothetical protein